MIDMPIVIDEGLPPNIVKFVQKDGSEVVVNIATGQEVIDG